MRGIKDSIPYKDVGLNIRGKRDKIKELITIEVPTYNGKR